MCNAQLLFYLSLSATHSLSPSHFVLRSVSFGIVVINQSFIIRICFTQETHEKIFSIRLKCGRALQEANATQQMRWIYERSEQEGTGGNAKEAKKMTGHRWLALLHSASEFNNAKALAQTYTHLIQIEMDTMSIYAHCRFGWLYLISSYL